MGVTKMRWRREQSKIFERGERERSWSDDDDDIYIIIKLHI